MRELTGLDVENFQERLDAARRVSIWKLGHDSWADLLISVFMAPEAALKDLDREGRAMTEEGRILAEHLAAMLDIVGGSKPAQTPFGTTDELEEEILRWDAWMFGAVRELRNEETARQMVGEFRYTFGKYFPQLAARTREEVQ